MSSRCDQHDRQATRLRGYYPNTSIACGEGGNYCSAECEVQSLRELIEMYKVSPSTTLRTLTEYSYMATSYCCSTNVMGHVRMASGKSYPRAEDINGNGFDTGDWLQYMVDCGGTTEPVKVARFEGGEMVVRRLDGSELTISLYVGAVPLKPTCYCALEQSSLKILTYEAQLPKQEVWPGRR